MDTAHTATKEFTAMTQSAKGGTQAVTVLANTEEQVRAKLALLGYHKVLWVL